ncbi:MULTISPECIES: 16S rRNA (cytidine(1402)-2'-O)-methyltransferase [unclassified Prochlorococcus]|uniref:16S rRNA (cytidine(1402)-2'-O)-methyltransferase n=1 Tax=unclassified Prochlorococcus TaxID=2627481 RepID=UPI00053394B1|nr:MULTISPECIES: 16S rRNA (cytidine(1402)-2'-O)-methyltransferase [unclassified Prochlorococcus]KGG16361.1 rRNA small subunit methyltransferase I [Prochlorococcus sp. MIT 0603]KGG17905.1 rRNA small subunit methyltransferase I [Prochlorococcus sp. MIT 0602]
MDLETGFISKNQLEPKPGVLYIVGTPIGNLGDFSTRAKNLLSKVSVIACEDTRHSKKLLNSFNIKTKLLSFHQHNTRARVPIIIELLDKGESIALITDAGLPSISDPGEELIAAARKTMHDVICVPGPCAATVALAISGLPSQRFCFEGFLPSKTKERKLILNLIAQEKRTTVIYESPYRLLKLLKDLSDLCGEERPISISRELTKKHEEQIGPTIGDAINYFLDTKPRGEFTIVLGGAKGIKKVEINVNELIEEVKRLISNGSSTNNAVKEIAQRTGYPRNFLYSLIHENNNKNISA